MSGVIIFYIFIFVIGLAVGSFLNVVICRVPAKQSIVYPASRCPKCGHSIKPYENIPVISYLVLCGKCSECKSRISIQYPLVELATGIMFLLTTLRIGLAPQLGVYLPFTAVLICLTVIDFQTQLLPDGITLPSILVASILALLTLHPAGADFWHVSALHAFLGILAGAGPLWLIAEIYYRWKKREGMGGGDIKLMAFAGVFLGPKLVLLALFLGACAGTVIALPVSLIRGGDRYSQIPFGPYLATGIWISALWGEQIVQWYLSIAGLG